MIMTEAQICQEYKESKKPSMQIAILADLNLCKKEEIVNILEKNGIKVAKPSNAKKPVEVKKATVPPEVKAILEDSLNAIDAQIKELENQYKVISAFLCEV